MLDKNTLYNGVKVSMAVEMDKSTINKRIDELLEEKHISLYKLKENAEISTTIYQWKKNTKREATRLPSLRSLERVCNFLGISLAYFFSFDKNMQNEIQHQEFMKLAETLTTEEIEALTTIIHLMKQH